MSMLDWEIPGSRGTPPPAVERTFTREALRGTWEDWSPEKKGIFFANIITMVPFFFWWRHSRRSQGKRYMAFKYSEHDWATSGKQRTIHHLLMTGLITWFRSQEKK